MEGTGPRIAGLEPTSYEALLGAVGRVLDSEGWQGVRLSERAEGLLVEGHAAGPALAGGQAYLFRPGELAALLRGAARRAATDALARSVARSAALAARR